MGTMDPQTEVDLAPLHERLLKHPLYAHLHDAETLRLFMSAHVFAVWDFQCLLKGLQRLVTCVEVPWLPTADPEARRLINEIVLDEESDEAPGGGYLSHFELYLQAMRESGADSEPIEAFLGGLTKGLSVDEALATCAAPAGVAPFVRTTLAIARSPEPHRVAAAFAYGREEIIPAMFRRLVDRLATVSPQSWGTFRYYLERHIQTDADRHGPQSRLLVRRLCGDDPGRWSEAMAVAESVLKARDALWAEIARTLRAQEELTA
jgi:pyrroloquinoline quinone (PQQ) biosynthesis protein C